MPEIATLMFSHLIVKPCVENLVELVIPWFKKKMATCKQWWRRRRGDAVLPSLAALAQRQSTPDSELPDRNATAAQRALLEKVREEMLLPMSRGTFDEYRTKVLQFGYVAMFSVAFPVGMLAVLVANIIELRVDAYKFVFASQRPSWASAARR